MILLTSDINSVAQFITVLFIFIGVLALTYFVTRWTANFQKGRLSGGNMEVLDTMKVGPDKYVQIVRVTDKYLAIGLGKDSVTLLAELSEDAVINPGAASTKKLSFEDMLEKVKEKKKDE